MPSELLQLGVAAHVHRGPWLEIWDFELVVGSLRQYLRMTGCNFRTNKNKEWRQLYVGHSRVWEAEPGFVRPETFLFSATDTQPPGGTRSVILTTSEAIALRDWLTEHINE